MKLKYKFVIRNIDGKYIAVAVGRDNEKFRGMIKLNDTGCFIFERLSSETDAERIARELAENYSISPADALQSVTEFTAELKMSGLLED